MSLVESPGSLGCIGCVAAPAAQAKGAAAAEDEIVLAVPGADCAACIPALEEGLAGFPGVRDVRVNLSLRRLRVRHDGSLTPEALIPEVTRLGYEALPLDLVALSGTENDRIGRDLVMRLGVAFFAMMNVMLLSVAVWSGASDATGDMFHFISGAIALPTVLFSGQPFFRSAWAGVKRGRLGMDFPISLALVLASSISVYESFNDGHHAYFDAAVMLTFFLLGGRYLDHMTRAAARSAAQELAALEVPRAIRINGDVQETVNVSDLAVGDLISVRPGARVPADGIVEDGESEIDRSLLTGESLPARAAVGTPVSAGEVNLTGPLTVRVTAAGRDSSLARIAALVAVAEEARSRYTSLADRVARAYSPIVHTLSFSAFVLGLRLLDVEDGDRRALRHQHLSRNAHHHLPLRAGAGRAGRAGRGDGGVGQAVPQGPPHQVGDGAGAAGASGHGSLRQDGDSDVGRARAAGPGRARG